MYHDNEEPKGFGDILYADTLYQVIFTKSNQRPFISIIGTYVLMSTYLMFLRIKIEHICLEEP